MLKLLPHCSCLNLHLLVWAGAFSVSKLGVSKLTVWMCEWDAWEMLAKEWLMRTSSPVWRVTLCVRTTTWRESDAWRFHDDYNGLQSVHFTEARGTLQAAVRDCTGEQKHSWLALMMYVCVMCMIDYACGAESTSRLLFLVFGKRLHTSAGALLGVF